MDNTKEDLLFREMSELKEMVRDTQSGIQALDKNMQSLDKKVDLHIQKTEYELRNIQELDKEQNQILAEHSKRSERLEVDNKLREEGLRQEFGGAVKTLSCRIEVLEAPRKWLRSNWNLLLIGGASAEAIHRIIEFLTALKILSPK